MNFRRDGYDFEALWEDGKASAKQKKIMDLYSEESEEEEYYSNELKKKAGFGKEGEKGFEGTVTGLQMQMYLCVRDFRKRKNKKGEPYGWPIAVYTTPEHLWGYDDVTSAYKEDPADSAMKLVRHLMDVYPVATDDSELCTKVTLYAVSPTLYFQKRHQFLHGFAAFAEGVHDLFGFDFLLCFL